MLTDDEIKKIKQYLSFLQTEITYDDTMLKGYCTKLLAEVERLRKSQVRPGWVQTSEAAWKLHNDRRELAESRLTRMLDALAIYSEGIGGSPGSPMGRIRADLQALIKEARIERAPD